MAVFTHGALRLYLLSVLQDAPRHGYELITELTARFGGTYSPSAGTIYPRLAKLEEEGLVTKIADGRKTVYEITDAGRAELAARQSELRQVENDVTDSVRRLADEVRSGVQNALKSLRADLASAARDAGRTATAAGTPTPEASPDGATRARFAQRDAELAVNEFRDRVRAELRVRAVRGELTAEDAARIRDRLRAFEL